LWVFFLVIPTAMVAVTFAMASMIPTVAAVTLAMAFMTMVITILTGWTTGIC